MKWRLLISIVLVLASSLAIVGCNEEEGVSQADYDALVRQLETCVSQENYDAVVAERDAARDELAGAEAQIEELEADAAQAAAYAEFMAFYMGERPETAEEMQAYGMEMESKLIALNDAELLAMFQEIEEAYASMAEAGLTEEEMMTEMMDEYMAVFSYIMDKIVEALGVEQ